jgi:ABC-type nitrate/sulfonate/bicarbonate transport system ATPase subunit
MVYTGLGLPPVIVGLFASMFLWRSGPLGFLVSRQILLADFERIVRKTRITTASVTHHANEAFALTDQCFEASRLLEPGSRSPREVFCDLKQNPSIFFRKIACEPIQQLTGSMRSS